MADYTGTRCMICSEKFTESDDIVVCPECGTPYHKACYAKEGKCVNTFLHENGGTWKPAYDVGSGMGAENESAACPFCGNVNSGDALFCQKCGMPTARMRAERGIQFYSGVDINENPGAYNSNANGGVQFNPFLINFSDPLCGYSPDEDVEGVKMSELGDFIGTNTHYYLPIFKRFKETGRQLSWNFSAMFFPELYFSYRKMVPAAILALLIRFFSRLPTFIFYLASLGGFGIFSEFASQFNINGSAFQGAAMLCSAASYALMFTAGIMANRLYYRSALKKIKKIKSADGIDLRYTLCRKGGTSALLMVLFICLMALPSIILFMTAIPFPM